MMLRYFYVVFVACDVGLGEDMSIINFNTNKSRVLIQESLTRIQKARISTGVAGQSILWPSNHLTLSRFCALRIERCSTPEARLYIGSPMSWLSLRKGGESLDA